MSRYSFNPFIEGKHDESITVIVGWDNPLQTLFAQVVRTETDITIIRDGVELDTMLGMGFMGPGRGIVCLRKLEEIIGYDIPDNLRNQLLDDRDNRLEPTRLQKMMSASLFGA